MRIVVAYDVPLVDGSRELRTESRGHPWPGVNYSDGTDMLRAIHAPAGARCLAIAVLKDEDTVDVFLEGFGAGWRSPR